jgi:beta-carotene isomerase
LEDMEYNDSILDKLLLNVFRKLVVQNTGGITSDKPGIEGLLEQGRAYLLQPGQTDENQHKMVRDTLAGLMTPVLPPFYRIFMSGIVPKLGTDLDGKQFGPWFYAPFLTSFVTPTFFGFLVGPSYPNRRKDGHLGGLVVEKCKFLQESGCKGLCLHQCKLPAQQFFKNELGLALTVSPNFVTQECQWSFGEEPLLPSDDPSFPKGCLVGCESRKAVAGTNVDLCN